jgi:hypothetical protein
MTPYFDITHKIEEARPKHFVPVSNFPDGYVEVAVEDARLSKSLKITKRKLEKWNKKKRPKGTQLKIDDSDSDSKSDLSTTVVRANGSKRTDTNNNNINTVGEAVASTGTASSSTSSATTSKRMNKNENEMENNNNSDSGSGTGTETETETAVARRRGCKLLNSRSQSQNKSKSQNTNTIKNNTNASIKTVHTSAYSTSASSTTKPRSALDFINGQQRRSTKICSKRSEYLEDSRKKLATNGFTDASKSPISGNEMFYPKNVQNHTLYEFTRLVKEPLEKR